MRGYTEDQAYSRLNIVTLKNVCMTAVNQFTNTTEWINDGTAQVDSDDVGCRVYTHSVEQNVEFCAQKVVFSAQQ